jgi:hypothetical protein
MLGDQLMLGDVYKELLLIEKFDLTGFEVLQFL